MGVLYTYFDEELLDEDGMRGVRIALMIDECKASIACLESIIKLADLEYDALEKKVSQEAKEESQSNG